jgi:hypothetical protein
MVITRATCCLAATGLTAVFAFAPTPAQAPEAGAWTAEFATESGELGPTGRNPYFILEPGYRLTLEGGSERLVVTVLDETRVVAGIESRIVEERETRNDHPVEVSRNYFAISARTNGVFYLGEEVDAYRGGTVVGHEGSWLAGVGAATFGLMMPGQPLIRSRYYEELAPGIALDRAEIVGLNETVVTPLETFAHCLKIEETTPLEPGTREYKYYAHGVGLVQDGALKLVSRGAVRP